MSKDALELARMACDTIMEQYPPRELPPSGRFHYHQGVFLSGMNRTYLLSGDTRYNKYIKQWLDEYIDQNGNVHGCSTEEFDDMQPAILLFRQYRETEDARYKKVLDDFARCVEKWPTNARGGYWHKSRYVNQMWLDGLYMIGPFQAMYARRFGDDYFFERAYRQFKLMDKRMRDKKTGLMYHAWDDSKRAPWADKKTGLSPEFWGRAIGWYMTALVDMLDWFRPEDSRAEKMRRALKDIIKAVAKHQDKDCGLWRQVVNRTDDENNWFETSCSALFTYAIAKAARKGIVGKEYDACIHRGYEGVAGAARVENGRIKLGGICIGTGVGKYDDYLERPTSINDLHGMGAFILMCCEYKKYTTK